MKTSQMNKPSTDSDYTRAIWMTLVLAICYGICAIIYDLKLAVVYFGMITVGATAYGAMMTKLRIREQAIRELIEEMRRTTGDSDQLNTTAQTTASPSSGL